MVIFGEYILSIKMAKKRLNPVSYCIDRHNTYEAEEVSGEMANFAI